MIDAICMYIFISILLDLDLFVNRIAVNQYITFTKKLMNEPV